MTKRLFQFINTAFIISLFYSCSSSRSGVGNGLPQFTRISRDLTIEKMYAAVDNGFDAIQFGDIMTKKARLVYIFDSVENYIKIKKQKEISYFIEMTASADPVSAVNTVMSVVNDRQLQNRIFIVSADLKTLQYLHKQFPDIKIAFLATASSNSSFRKQINDLGFNPSIYYAENPLVNDALVKDCKGRKIKLFVWWATDDKDEIKRMKSMGVDGVATNNIAGFE